MPRSRGNTSTHEIGGGGGGDKDTPATAPGQARNLSADTSKALEITFKATAPASNGKKKGGAAVTKAELKYQLYYAKITGSITDTTTAAEVIKAVGSTTGTDDKAKGRIEALANNLAAGFTLSSLTATHTYRYTVVVIHPDGTTNSEPAGAQTSEAVRATPSKATKTGVPILNTPNPKTSTGFTVTWNDPDLTTAKKDDDEPLQAGDVGYVVYYTSATEAPADKEAVKAAGSEDTPTSGKVPVGATKTATASGKAFVHTVYMVLEAINTTDTSKTKLSEITEYAVTGAATSPTAPTVNVTPGETQLTVQVTPLTTGFGTTDNGTPLDADKVTYIFYYAKKGEDIDVDGTSTKVEDAKVTSDHMYDVLKGLSDDGTANTANKGKVVLTAGAGNGLGSGKVVPKLTPATDYHYTVRVQETAAPANGANTAKAKATTLAPKPTVKKPLPATCGKAPWDPGQWCVSTLASEGFNQSYRIAAAKDGNTLYIADTSNHQIKKLTLKADGSFEDLIIIAGDGTKDDHRYGAYKDHATGKKAQFNFPTGIALASDALYVGERENHRIRKIVLTPPYRVSTIAGDGTRGKADGDGIAAKLNKPVGIAIAPDGKTLYFSSQYSDIIRKIVLTPPYRVSTIAGGTGGTADGDGKAAQFKSPIAIAIAPDGNALYVIDSGSDLIRKLTLISPYAVITIAGNNTSGDPLSLDSPTGIDAQFNDPSAIAITPDGNALYLTEYSGNRIRKIVLSGTFPVTTIAGSTKGNTNGIGTRAQFNGPRGIVAVSNTLLYVVDSDNDSIRKLEYKAKED